MLYQVDQYYTFAVRPGNPADDFYTLEVDGPDGPATVTLSKLEFQKDPHYVQPRRLECRVRAIDDSGLPVLGHAIGSYVNQLYADTYSKDESFGCIVVGVPANPVEEPYNVRDGYGIFYRVYEPGGLLTKGQRIRCKFKYLSSRRFEIKRVDEKSKLPYIQPHELLDAAGVAPQLREAMLKLLGMHVFDNVRSEIEALKPQWPLSAAAVVREHINEWFVTGQMRGLGNLSRGMLEALRRVMLYLLEGSNYLNGAFSEHRRSLQQFLTELVEGLHPYELAQTLFEQHSEDAFVEGLFDKLQKSGYLYHPSEQFGVMMLIFRVYPQKVSTYLNRIFESIFMRDFENWKREPFRSAFVEQFEIYVRQARRDIDDLPLAESREQKARLEAIITALALEILLSDKNATPRTRSLFYRYVSLLRPLNSEALLSKSFMALMGVEMPERLEYSMLREPMMMMTRATVLPGGDLFSRLSNSCHYTNGTVDITINEAGLTLSRTADRAAHEQDMVERIIPEGLMPWLRPQIRLNGVRSFSGSKLRRLADHNNWWKQIETNLFDGATVHAEPVELRKAVKGEEVWIVIDSVSDAHDNDPTFNCHIQHEGFVESTGYIKRSQIVNYNLRQPSVSTYRSPDGSSLGFYARIIDIDDNDNYVFSLISQVNAYIQSVLNFNDEYLAVITGNNPQGYSGISSDGIGLYLRDEDNTGRRFTPGSIVRFRLHSGSTQGSIVGYITEPSNDENDHFDKTTAFAKLMNAIGERDDSAEVGENLVSDDIQDYLSADTIREIVEILRFGAIAESDIIKAYDYLCYARLMALAIGDEQLASKLGTHASLLVQHQFFATNKRIDAESLENIRNLSHADPLLSMIFHRVEIVSWLGQPEQNGKLFATVASPGSELEGSLARMVLSYNMIQNQNDGDDKIADALKTRIMEKLNVNSETRHGKYYGTESKYLEFKTSLVFPAVAPGSEMREDPVQQQMHIMSRIAGMLNANGGRLYIGVNNDGYAVGLLEDFRYYERHKARIGNRTFNVRNMDSLCVFLENLIYETFGPTVSRKIEVAADEDTDKDVVLINITESLTPVFIDGHLYVRQSGQSTREYHGVAVTEFVAEREQQRIERQHLEAISAAEAAEEHKAEAADYDVPDSDCADSGAVDDETSEDENVADRSNRIATSLWRPNVLHSYEDGYKQPDGYIYFNGDSELRYSSTDLYCEDNAGCRLALVVPHELRDGYLILGFENERAVRVPLSEIISHGDNNPLNYNGEFGLIFAAVAGKDDLLLNFITDSGDSVWRRAVTIGQIEQEHVNSVPKRLYDIPATRTVGWEIVDSSAIENFAGCMSDRLSGRRFGEPLRVRASEERFAGKLKEIAESCRGNS